MAVSFGVMSVSTQALLVLSVICCTLCAKLPAVEQQSGGIGSKAGVIAEGHDDLNLIAPATSLARNSLPIVASTDDLEIVAHTGGDGIGRQKRYVGWGRKPSLRYSKANSVWDHDSLFNRVHNNFDKRLGPQAPISNFRELRMKQKVPNIQILLPHLPMRNTRIPSPSSPDTDVDEGAGLMINDLDRTTGGKLTQEDLDALAYLLEGDMP